MAKDINIHIKATGGPEAKQQLEGVAQGAQKVGSGAQDMGQKALIGSGWVQKALSFLAGPLGFAGIAGAVAGGAIKVAQFFDEIKTRSDEAVRKVQEIRASFEGLFEVLDVYSEKSRQALMLETTALLQRTAVTEQAGLPVITAYAREFKKTGLMPGPQYQAGLEQMLQWGALHPGRAAAEMPQLMAGFGLTTPKRQAEFTRMISAVSEKVGFDEADFMESLGRGMTGFKALGFTPEQSIEMAGKVALASKGLPARQRATMLSIALSALVSPQIPKEIERKIPRDVQEDPAKLFAWVRQRQGLMPQKDYVRFLQGIYGAESGPGLYAYITSPEIGIGEVMEKAKGPLGVTEQARQFEEYEETMEATAAKTETANRQEELAATTEEETYTEKLRLRGETIRGLRRKRHPVRQWFRELITIGEEAEKEQAVYAQWAKSLTKEGKLAITREILGPGITEEQAFQGGAALGIALPEKWNRMTAKEQWQNTPVVINQDHSSHVTFNPVAGDPNSIKGARSPSGSKGLY